MVSVLLKGFTLVNYKQQVGFLSSCLLCFFFLGTKISILTNFQKEIQGVHTGTLLLATEILLHLCCTSFLLLLTFWVALNESEA